MMKSLFTPTAAQNLVQLTTLKISDCNRMIDIVGNEGDRRATYHQTALVLSKLKSLELVELQSLTSFSSGSYSFDFPCLEKLVVKNCPGLKIFSQGILRTPLLQSVIVETYPEERHWNGDLNTTVQQLFRKKVELEFSDTYPEMIEIWNGGNPQEYWDFKNLREMRFCKCSRLKFIFTPCMLLSLEQLCVIEIKECDSMDKVIKEEEEATSTNELRFPKLISIRIESCSNMTIFYSGSRPLEFPNLGTIKIADCPKMTAFCSSNVKNIFTASIAKELTKLQDLRISDCGVDEIVTIEEGVEQQLVTVKFPQVSYLELTGLKKLKCFYEGQHTVVWPMLKELKTDCSTLLKILSLEGAQQSGLLVNEVIPKPEKLQIKDFGDSMDQCPPDLFHQIKAFEVNGSLTGSSIFPFLRRFYNLDTLELLKLDFKDEVSCKTDDGTLTRIQNLKLKSSENLKHIWKKDSELGHLLSHLQTLNLQQCHDLTNVGPSSLSFLNLTSLEVANCKMMENLFTPIAAQNLVQLTILKVCKCNKITEIVENIEGDSATSHHQTTLVLNKLKSLELGDLQSLTSFSTGSYNFEFPSLEKLVVKGCRRLKIFSQGVLSTPRLHSVIVTRYNPTKRHWRGDLNTTIQQLYTEKVGFDGHQMKLGFSDTFPDLMEIWNSRNPREILAFKSLRSIIFCKCSSLKYVFTITMLLSLVNLGRIEVEKCDSLEEVIKEEEEEATSTHKLSFSHQTIKIKSCTNLTNFYSGSRPLEFPNLSTIKIADCPKMTAFGSSISREKGNGDGSGEGVGLGDVQHNTATFFSDQVVCSALKTLHLSSIIIIHKIWHNHIVHERLKSLRVKGCHNLRYLFPSFNMTERLEKLKELHIENCDSLEEIFGAQGLIADEPYAVTATQSITAGAVTTEFAFPRLTHLYLDKLPKLTSFCSRMHATRWPSLKKMNVTECPQVQIFAPQSQCSGERQTDPCQAGISNQQPLFSVNEDMFPSLEELTLKRHDLMKGICEGQVSLECFRELKALNLNFFPETSTPLPYSFIQSVPKLEKLLINDASICQIVQSEGLGEEEIHTSRLAQIKELRLSKLAELTHLWKEDFQPGVTLNNLRALQVLECGKLKTLEPSLLSFKYLTDLEVSRCHGFIKLMARSTAKSLTLLERMSITECEMIEEIISCEGEEIQGGIVFPKLKYLHLSCLSNLASFSLAHHMFEFPVLVRVVVKKCNKMRNFCQGDLSTPNLQQMHLTIDDEDELWWEGDLNTTIKKMFNETVHISFKIFLRFLV